MTRLNARREKFCQFFVLYGNAAAAAREARYAPESVRQQGYRLLQEEDVRARIVEIQEEMGRRDRQNLLQFLGKLECVYQRALSDHQFYSAARAVELQFKLGGMKAPKLDGLKAPRNGALDNAHE